VVRPQGRSNPFRPNPGLDAIGKSLGRQAYFLETVFNPWKVAENLSSAQEVVRLKEEQPQACSMRWR